MTGDLERYLREQERHEMSFVFYDEAGFMDSEHWAYLVGRFSAVDWGAHPAYIANLLRHPHDLRRCLILGDWGEPTADP